MANPSENTPAPNTAGETMGTIRGALVGIGAAAIALTGAALYKVLSNKELRESLTKAKIGDKTVNTLKFGNIALVAGAVGAAATVGGLVGKSKAKSLNEERQSTQNQIGEAANIIANQERELGALRGEAQGAREQFANMGAQAQGGFAERLQASHANASELGL